MSLFVGPRPDIAEAAQTVRFNLKFVDALALALPSLLLLFRLARPDAKPGALALWLFAPLILLAARRRGRAHGRAVQTNGFRASSGTTCGIARR